MNGRGNNQKASNVFNRNVSKGKTLISIGDKKVGVTLLWFKYGGHGHYVVAWASKGLNFCVEEPKFKFESYSKEEETHNEDELSKECDYFDGMTEGYNLVMRHLLVVPRVRE